MNNVFNENKSQSHPIKWEARGGLGDSWSPWRKQTRPVYIQSMAQTYTEGEWTRGKGYNQQKLQRGQKMKYGYAIRGDGAGERGRIVVEHSGAGATADY